jgi:hypothetical protein
MFVSNVIIVNKLDDRQERGDSMESVKKGRTGTDYKIGSRVRLTNNVSVNPAIPIGTLGTVNKKFKEYRTRFYYNIVLDGFGFAQMLATDEFEPYIECEMCCNEIDGEAFDSDSGGKVCKGCCEIFYATCDYCNLVAPRSEGSFKEESGFMCDGCNFKANLNGGE